MLLLMNKLNIGRRVGDMNSSSLLVFMLLHNDRSEAYCLSVYISLFICSSQNFKAVKCLPIINYHIFFKLYAMLPVMSSTSSQL